MAEKKEHIVIFDTTLRDGEQSPGATMTQEEKLLVADVLDAMGVDVIEAGFAMASDGDFEAVRAIAERTKHAVVCSLARCKAADIERAGEAVKPAKRGRIHTFISTSDIHLQHQFRLTREEVLPIITDMVTLARKYTDDVEWSAMDATRSDLDYLCKAVETAIKAGATTINLPDTVGYATPEDITHMFTYVRNNVPDADKVIFSFHGQNDLGLATANTLAAIKAGARQAELTINGIGERAGNTALEEVVMAIKTRPDQFPVTTTVKTELIMRASRLVSGITGFVVQNNKAIVGSNAFAHESGIHQDGMLKNASTYEIMTPESVGWKRSTLVLGKHSGRHAFRDKLQELGFVIGDNAFEDAFNRFKQLADKKKAVYDDDILALVDDTATERDDHVKFVSIQVTCGSVGAQHASLILNVDGNEVNAEEDGHGPVDAAFKAIRALVPHQAKLALYQVHAVTEGIDAQAEVSVRLEAPQGVLINGNGADVDTVVASVKAYVAALNKLLNYQEKIVPERASL
ncbi:MAG: 2-isopropylmalate synthase [Hyphomicrobiales bacterium]|nr:2-isopropylmalate synthase [Hyphomicrobiales bacterium]